MGDRGWGDVRRPEAEGALGSSIRGLGSERFLPEEAEPGRVARRQGQRRSVFQAVVDPLPCVLRPTEKLALGRTLPTRKLRLRRG